MTSFRLQLRFASALAPRIGSERAFVKGTVEIAETCPSKNAMLHNPSFP